MKFHVTLRTLETATTTTTTPAVPFCSQSVDTKHSGTITQPLSVYQRYWN